MIRSIKKKFLPDEFAKILKQANAYPRFTDKQFAFRHYTFKVTDFLSVAWQLKEIFEDETLYFNTKSTKPTIVDCGANVGIAVAYFKFLYPGCNVVCFEPDKNVFECLKHNIKTNGWENVVVHQAAIYNADTEMFFAGNGADGGSLHAQGQQKVKVLDLARILNTCESIDFLKIDIEGAETDVIKHIALQLHKVKYLFVEYHSIKGQPQQLNQLLQVLTEQGFRYYLKSINNLPWKQIANGRSADMDIQLNIHGIKQI
ncbi:MAG: FkbM family methyltransferase [Bacteroidia bacterium]|nr:FkbM family methyltransferase [Bacteroidia bacterium]HQV00051.1 FkbM family methyltransferase [Bacteroidia bacterium]